MTLPMPPAHLDPDTFAATGASFMSAKFLCVAADVGVFEKLGDGPLTLEELATKTGIPRRSLRVIVSGLVSMQVLSIDGGRYANNPEAQAFLAGKTSVDVRAGLKLYDRIVYPMWMQLESVVRSGQPAKHQQPSAEFAKIFSEGVEAWTALGARNLVDKYDFAAHKKILDVAGGTGSYLVPILTKHQHMRATLFDLPQTIEHAKRRLAHEAVGNRVDLVEGDAFFDALPDGHDVVLVGGFLHLFGEDKVVAVLKRIRERVAPGTALLLVDQWMNATHSEPAFGALLAGTYLLLSGEGDTYSVDEARGWLASTGWRFVEHKGLGGVTSLVRAEAA